MAASAVRRSRHDRRRAAHIDPASCDANGNLAAGLGRAYAWTAANLPATIDRLAGGAAVERSEFLYAPERERLRQVRRAMSGGSPGAVSHSIFYGGVIEKEIDFAANRTVIRTYMPEGIGFVEEEIAGTAIAPSASGTTQSRHFHRDRQGSLIAVTDFAGALLQRLSYDAWGRRRNNDGSDDSWGGLGTLANAYDRTGYTGQEHLDALGLVHLNGRVYDPLTGRMTSADPLVPDEEDLQALNRYSYVLNSPLGYVDPTGFMPRHPEGCWSGSHICKPITDGGPPPGVRTTEFAPPVEAKTTKSSPAPRSFSDSLLAAKTNAKNWIGDQVEAGDYSMMRKLLGAIIVSGIEVFFPETEADLIMMALGPVRVVGRLDALAGAAGAAKGTAAAHSVAFETTIAKAGVGSRGSHFTDANKSLAAAMNKDPAFAKMMDGLGVKIPQRLDQSPAGWSWHHVPNQPGTLQLVPRAQHQGGPWQPLLHPNQTGGFKLWGADY